MPNPTPMIATILDLERRAEAILEKARESAAAIQRSAQTDSAEALMAIERKTAEKVRDIDQRSTENRNLQVAELREQLSRELETVRNISHKQIQAGVETVLRQLRGSDQ